MTSNERLRCAYCLRRQSVNEFPYRIYAQCRSCIAVSQSGRQVERRRVLRELLASLVPVKVPAWMRPNPHEQKEGT